MSGHTNDRARQCMSANESRNDTVSRAVDRRAVVGGGMALAAAAALPGRRALAQGTGPIRVGGTLALTGPLAQTGVIHKVTGEAFIENINKNGGLMGRPIEWVLLDDQSKPDLARTLYEKLITVDKVDLLSGPYATGAILSAMAVAERYGKVLPHGSFGIPKLAKYDRQFPAWPLGPTPEVTIPNLVLDALGSTGKAPKTVAIVTSKFPSVQYMAVGARDVVKTRGLTEALYLEFEFGARDFGPIAARIREANADLLLTGTIGLEPMMMLEAMDKLNYVPKNHFYLYPTPGPLAASPLGKNALAIAIFEDLPPLNESPAARDFVRLFRAGAAKANLPYQDPETQAACGYSSWQILAAAVNATKSLDDKTLADWLKANKVETVAGLARFNEAGNYGDDLSKVKQVQDGKWSVVWPKPFATPGKSVVAS